MEQQAAGKRSEDYAPYPYLATPDPTLNARCPPEYQQAAWGTAVMGSPAEPASHPDNQEAATHHRDNVLNWESEHEKGAPAPGAKDKVEVPLSGNVEYSEKAYTHGSSSTPPAYPPPPAPAAYPGPYVQTANIQNTPAKSPMESILDTLSKWGKKAEVAAENVWSHLKTGPSMTDAAWGKLSQGTKVLTEGGYENVFRQTFGATADERLRKSYACYLSTSTGPVAGTLYISTVKLAFCSDRPLSYNPSPGQTAMSYYKILIPLDKVRSINPSTNRDKPTEKYIQVVTADNYEFWFMGFVNYDKGLKNLQLALNPHGSPAYHSPA